MKVKPVEGRSVVRAVASALSSSQPVAVATRTSMAGLSVVHESRGRVLVVEDNSTNQKLIRALLEKRGCLVDVAANGLEALAAVTNAQYCLIFMDCQMPKLDGWEATRRIRGLEAVPNRVPIVAFTAEVLDEDRERCFASGMDAFLAKPIQIEALDETLNRFLPEPNGGVGEAAWDERLALDALGDSRVELLSTYQSPNVYGRSLECRTRRNSGDA